MDTILEKIKSKALSHLSRREHSVQELRSKLSQHFNTPDLIERVLNELASSQLLSNSRFLESRIRHRLAQGYGALKIMQELTQSHGFKKSEVSPFLTEQAAETEESELARLIQKKYAQFKLDQPQEKAKLIQKLQQRGFAYSTIKRYFDQKS